MSAVFAWLACDTGGISGPDALAGDYDLVAAQVIAAGERKDSLVSGSLAVQDWHYTAEIRRHVVTAQGAQPLDTVRASGPNYTAGAPGCGTTRDTSAIFILPVAGDTVVTQSHALFGDARLRWVRRPAR